MSDEKTSAGLFDPEALEGLAEKFATTCGQDLGSLLNTPVELKSPIVERVTGEEATAHPAALLHARGRTGCATASIHLLVPRADAAVLAGRQLGEDAAAIEDRGDAPLEPDALAGFEGVAKLLLAVLGQLLEQECELSGLELDSVQEVAEPSADGGFLSLDAAVRMSFDLALEGFPKGGLEILLVDAASGGDAVTSNAPALYVIDPSEDQRALVESFETALERRVTTLDPSELGLEELRPLASAGAVLVAWDLGGRSGLELLEHLVWDEHMAGIPVLLASDAPTRGKVAAALRGGAHGFLHRPYDANEIRRRAFGEDALPAADGAGGES